MGTLSLLVVLNVPIYGLLGGWWFDGWEDFTQCVWYWFKWDWWSWMDGSFLEDFWGELKLWSFCLACMAVVGCELWLLEQMPILLGAIRDTAGVLL